ncbi:acyltransferase family protein [Corallococcus terminator]|uniref:Acyltransferase n=1 Tax=Corallococcus terminator TaxID=2316733 RepID=A0A3A8JEZ4_9BACT|nr:acyltransferase [Corallococcus terminator]RKG93546.1 acyltransferase [Corallococcus terminator]
MASSRRYLDVLTGLRFLAAAHIGAYHLYHMVFTGTEAPPGLHGLLDSGYVSVGFFFVLSGFILGYHHLERPPDTREVRKAFWVARFARVYPLYALGLVLAAPAFFKGLHAAWVEAPGELWRLDGALVLAPLLMQSWVPWTALAWNGAGWSLAVEAVFYAVFPFLAVRLGQTGPRALMLGAGVAYALALVLPVLYLLVDPDHTTASSYHSGPWMRALRFNPVARLPEFILGLFAGRYFLLRADTAPRPRPVVLMALGVVILAALMASTSLPFPLMHNGLLAPVFAALLVLLPRSQGFVARVLASRPFCFLGEASYSLYILHMPLLFTWKSVMKRLEVSTTSVGAVVVLTVGVLVLCVLAHQWVEKPARRWIRAWWARRGARQAEPAIQPQA